MQGAVRERLRRTEMVMIEEATEQVAVGATPEACFNVVVDFERYPEWALDVKRAEVLERDEQGRGVQVSFQAAAMGHSAHYVLAYDYSQAPSRLVWTLKAGDIVRRLDGEYRFDAGAQPGTTEVTYRLAIELAVPLPGFLKRRAEGKIVTTALDELKRRCEEVGLAD